jgi:hypothetical protein
MSPLLESRVVLPDPHYFWKLDLDPHESEKLDPDPESKNSEALEAQNRAVDAYNRGLEAQNRAIEDLETSGRRFPSL